MLVLIAGLTGTVGQEIVKATLAKGHKVRGLARSPDKLNQDVASALESFVRMKDVYDITAFDNAVQGVDAIVCAWNWAPEVTVDGQILLLRAAERAGVKIFHAASWNFPWTRNKLGEHEAYDCYIAFWNHARISSVIKPIYGFTGALPEYTLITTTRESKLLDVKNNTINFFGDGTKQQVCTTAKDIAAYAIEAISEPNAAEGGFYYVESFRMSILGMAEVYDELRGTKLERKSHGSLEDVERMLVQARATISPLNHEEYVGLAYMKYWLDGTWDFEPLDSMRWSSVKQTSFKEWLVAHPEV